MLFKHYIDSPTTSEDEGRLAVGNNTKVEVEFIGDVCLIFWIDFKLLLKDTFYIPAFRQNLIYVSALDNFNYGFNISSGLIQLFYEL